MPLGLQHTFPAGDLGPQQIAEFLVVDAETTEGDRVGADSARGAERARAPCRAGRAPGSFYVRRALVAYLRDGEERKDEQ